MRLSQINQSRDKYILEESVVSLYDAITKEGQAIIAMAEDNREVFKVNTAISEYLHKYLDHYVAIQTLLSIDRIARNSDDNRPSIFGIGKIVNSNDIESTKEELSNFLKKVVPTQPRIQSTVDVFRANIMRMAKRNHIKYKGIHAVKEMVDILETNRGDMKVFGKAVSAKQAVAESEKTISVIVQEMIVSGYDIFGETLTEAKAEDAEDSYFMVVELKLFDSAKSDTQPTKNFKNTLITKAKTHNEARRKFKQLANRSLKEVNKSLKSKGLKVAFSKADWSNDHAVYKGQDSIKKKNIKGLTGSEAVSTGVIVLKGLSSHGNVSSTPEYAPNRFALLGSKSSITRYLNKQFPKEE